ncbi:EthD domain-containing protein [Dactylonectria macrodidyma]|uniref:EthD domain-containing protein n=1 Tax=Dactylonectria macrodidyma TaxID=307937 RepID=A0A9P9EXU3_9HYPO|nr:EthD domain-containing protein [Dactylonectria macrodidyma]
MTYKVLMVVYRNPNLTPSQFKDHYENTHIPLMKSLTGEHFPLLHTRRYLQRSGADNQYAATVLSGSQSDFDYDCLSILEFKDAEGFSTMSALLSSPELASKVEDDCAAFMDPAKTKVVVLEETLESRR